MGSTTKVSQAHHASETAKRQQASTPVNPPRVKVRAAKARLKSILTARPTSIGTVSVLTFNQKIRSGTNLLKLFGTVSKQSSDLATGVGTGLAAGAGLLGVLGHSIRLHQMRMDEQKYAQRSEELAEKAHAYRKAFRQLSAIDEIVASQASDPEARAQLKAKLTAELNRQLEANVDAHLEYARVTAPLQEKPGIERSTIGLDKQQSGSNVLRYLSNFLGGCSTITGLIFTGVRTVAGSLGAALGGIASIAELSAAHAQRLKAKADLAAAREKLQKLEIWKQSVKATDPQAESRYNAYARTVRVRKKLARTTLVTARLNIFKGSVGLVGGIASAVLLGMAMTPAAPIAAGVAGIVAVGCLSWAIAHMLKESQVARHAKRQQRQARTLLATHPLNDLARMIDSPNPQDRKAMVATVERKHALTRKKTTRVRTVDVGANPYLCAMVDARQAADALMSAKPGSEGKAARERIAGMMKALGRSDADIHAYFLKAAKQATREAVAAVLAEQTIRSLQLPWIADSKPLPAMCYAGRLAELGSRFTDQQTHQVDFEKLTAAFYKTVDRAAFEQAMDSYLATTAGKKESSDLAHMARRVWRHRSTTARSG